MKKFPLLSIALLIASFTYAQDPSAKDSLAVNDSLEAALTMPIKKRPYLWSEISFGGLTNSASTSSMANFVFKDFLDQEDKDALVAPVGSYLRYGFMREISIGYREPWYKVFDTYQMGHGFSIRNTYYNSARMSSDLLNVVMFGNKPYADETLSLDGSAYETWYFSSLDYHFDVLIDSVQPVSFSVSLHVGHDHNQHKVNTGTLYTEPDGAYLDLDLDYRLRSNTMDAHPLAGIGVGIGVNTAFRLSDNDKLVIDVRDVGVMNWHQGRLLEADTTFRFRGLRFDNVFAITDSLTSYTNDRYTEAFLYEDEDDYMVALPFYASASYHHKFKNSSFREISVQADYRYLSGFYPRLTVATDIKTGYKQNLMASVSTGGYTWFSLNAGYELTFARLWTVRAGIRNINGLILPGVFGGAIGTLNLKYQL